MTDVDDDHARCQLRLEDERWQYLAVTAECLICRLHTQLLQGVRANPGLPRSADERLQIEVLHRRAGDARCRWQAQRFDADQAHRQRPLPGKTHAPFHDRGYRPAQLAQLQVQRLLESLCIASHQLRLHRAGQQRTGTGVVIACLAVQGLDAGPQRGGQPQSGKQAEELQTMAPPMAQQRLQGHQQGVHQAVSTCTRPACRKQRCCRRAARRWLWVTINTLLPASATSCSSRLST
ncbi:hypothetical protein D3C81_761410 [compost metagenome]